MIRFVENDAEGLPLKRKQSQRACENCRKRKKRCPHQHTLNQARSATSRINHSPSPHNQGTSSETIMEQHRLDVYEQHQPHIATNQNSSRPPTQIFTPVTTGSMTSAAAGSNPTDVDEDDEDHDLCFVGELNPEGIFVAGASPAGTTATAAAGGSPEDVVGIWVPRKWVSATKSLPGPILTVLLPHLEDECSRALPKHSDYESIYRIYLDEVHPILPVLNLNYHQRQQGKSKLLLKLAVCLMVVSNPKAARHLKQPPKAFTEQVTQLLKSAIDNGLVRDKQIIIQLLIILSLSTQLSDDRHASAEFASRAVSYLYTGGLHLDSINRKNDAYITRLFCCVFTLDRLNAAVQGRPVMMHERDLGRDLDASIKQQDTLFQLLLQVVLLLDRVIALYRPSLANNNTATNDPGFTNQNFPAFEDLMGMCGTVRAPATLVATVETLYHAVAMLSCRSQSLSKLSRNSASHTRQSLSAASIMSIAGNEYRGQLSILPFVPYAMSLALRVSYRDLRLSRSSFTRTRARRQLLHVCTLLRELGDIFSSSIHMVELAEQIVREMDKTYSAVAGQRRASLAPITMAATVASDEARQPSESQQLQTAQQDSSQNESPPTDNVIARQTISSTPEAVTMSENYNMQAFDLGQFDFDLDIFEHFDPDFNIEAIDATLANSIDPSMPLDMVDWDLVST